MSFIEKLINSINAHGLSKTLGVEILNMEISGAVNADRKLITGDSPLAANNFGRTYAEALLGE